MCYFGSCHFQMFLYVGDPLNINQLISCLKFVKMTPRFINGATKAVALQFRPCPVIDFEMLVRLA